MYVSCSWDDGKNDPAVIAVLRDLGITKATFFPCYWWLHSHCENMQELYDGFEVGNHTFNHPHLPHILSEQVVEQVYKMEEYLIEKNGQKPEGFAFPYGDLNQGLHNSIISMGYSYTRGVEGTQLRNVNFIGPDSKYPHENFWNIYEFCKPKGMFIFYGHARDVVADVLKEDLQKMLDDGCEFITHQEVMEMRKLYL